MLPCMKHSRHPVTPEPPTRLLSTHEVMARTTLSRSTLWRLSREGRIPQPIQITPNRIGWREAEITAWLDGKPGAPEARA